ncbi:hypothetical protein CK203_103495 [Vitis vinifera]|uniref:Uncharacterized protein n=1 Tax=Vitis vinifera TaxID=29760 RepID=A0A438DJY3_VITVI|nr:hypothetical protein CK203_103495 [Vitis vinifera]
MKFTSPEAHQYKRCTRTHHGNEGHSGSIEETRGYAKPKEASDK